MSVSESPEDTLNHSISSMLKSIVDSMAKLEDEVSDMVEMLESLFPNISIKESMS